MRTLILAASLAALAGCTSLSPADDPVYLKLQDLEARLIRIERVVDNESLISLASEVSQLRSATQAMRGEVETLGFEAENNVQRQRDLYADLDTRLAAMEEGQATMAQQSRDAARTSSNFAVSSTNLQQPQQAVSTPPPRPSGSDQDNYSAAFELIQGGRYEQAAAAFTQFLSAFPSSPLADNAQYWLAETYYVRGNYNEALPAFQKMIDDYPQSQKLADAMLKLGYTYYELGRSGQARTALQGVSRDFPDTTAARLALERLQRMDQETN